MDIRLSPITRLSLTLGNEMNLDKDGTLFNDDLYRSYLTMYSEGIRRRDNIMKSVVIADLLLIMVVNGQTITVPGVGLSLIEFPGAHAATMIFASLAFLFFAIAFFNEQAYAAIVRQFSIRRAQRTQVDPDFLIAADTFHEFFLKLSRKKLNIWGPDFFEPKRSYLWFFSGLMFVLSATFGLLLLLHLSVITLAIYSSQTQHGWDATTTAISIFAALANIAGALILASMTRDFAFHVPAGMKGTAASSEAGSASNGG